MSDTYKQFWQKGRTSYFISRYGKPETVEQLAKKIIDYNFRFLDDFDFKEWD